MSFNLLFFNAVQLNEDAQGISLSPNFLCPYCGAGKKPAEKIPVRVASEKIGVSTIDKGIVKPLDVDFNKQITFSLPCCGTKIALYVAIHKSKIGQAQTCISIEPISIDWWVKPDEAVMP